VTLSRAFAIQETEVTWGQWAAQGLARDPGGWIQDASGGQTCLEAACPVAHVTWFEAAAYANLLSERHDPPLPRCYELSGCVGELGRGLRCAGAASRSPSAYACQGFRLPTSAEWEYAARAGSAAAFYSGPIAPHGSFLGSGARCDADANLRAIGWYCHNAGNRSHPVKALRPNAWGLYDMAGNVAEWSNDAFDSSAARAAVDPGGTVDSRSNRTVRGGSYLLPAASCRMANQSVGHASIGRNTSNGFRLVRTLPAPAASAAL
jgi:formylglycine-generating enzyme required for sulfatase activity